jgi:hypothetical protein
MKKLLYSIIATSLCFAFVGCTETNSTTSETPTTPAEITETTAEETTTASITQAEKTLPEITKPVSDDPPTPDNIPRFVVTEVSSKGIKHHFENYTDYRFIYGYDYNLWVKDGDVWRKLRFRNDVATLAIGLLILPNAQTEERVTDFTYFEGIDELPRGEYRFEKNFNLHFDEEGYSLQNKYTAVYEFVI